MVILYIEKIDGKDRFTIEMQDIYGKLKWESFNSDEILNYHMKLHDIKIDEVRVV